MYALIFANLGIVFIANTLSWGMGRRWGSWEIPHGPVLLSGDESLLLQYITYYVIVTDNVFFSLVVFLTTQSRLWDLAEIWCSHPENTNVTHCGSGGPQKRKIKELQISQVGKDGGKPIPDSLPLCTLS